jgi:hypothetical protein
MPHHALSNDEFAALVKEPHSIVENDRYALSPRVRTSVKLRPEPAREPLPPPKV